MTEGIVVEAPVRENEFTSAEAAELLHVSRQTIVNWIIAGNMKARKSGLGQTAPYMIAESEVLRVAELLGLSIEDELTQLER